MNYLKKLMLITLLISLSAQFLPMTLSDSYLVFPTFLAKDLEQNKAIWNLNRCPTHKGSAEQQKVVCMAWEISNYDKDFILLIKAENGLLNIDRKHPLPHWCVRTQRYEYDWGLGISACYHPSIVGDPRYFTDPYWNIQKTYELYKGGTKFYGWEHRQKAKASFIFY